MVQNYQFYIHIFITRDQEMWLVEHTSEQMILQASSRHEFVHQEPVFVFQAIANQLHKMRMIKLPQVINFCLYKPNKPHVKSYSFVLCLNFP